MIENRVGRERLQDTVFSNVPVTIGHVALFSECYRPIVNGVVASIDTLCAALAARGIAVTTFAPYDGRANVAAPSLVRLPSLPLPTSTGYRLCLPYMNARDRARLAGVDVVHAHSPFVSGWLSRAVARKLRVPLVFTYHTRIDAYAHYAPFDARATRAALIALTRAFANEADVVIAPTAAMEARLREIGVTSRIAIVPSAIDVQRFTRGTRDARSPEGAAREARVALVVARLGREKNIALAIDALASAGEIELAIAGEGPHRAALEARARLRGVAARVRFLGAVDPARMPDLYASCDAFVMPSTSETQGLVLAEALVAGLPIVAVDSPVTREVLGPAGRIVPPDAERLGRALAAAVAGERPGPDPNAALRFAPALYAQRMIDAYQSAVHLAL